MTQEMLFYFQQKTLLKACFQTFQQKLLQTVKKAFALFQTIDDNFLSAILLHVKSTIHRQTVHNSKKAGLKTGTHFAFLRAGSCVLRIKNAFQRSGKISILVGHKQVHELDNCLGGLEGGLGGLAQGARHPLGTGSTLADSAQQEYTVLKLAYGGIYKQNGDN